ncbi:hypothetical protein FVF58_21320, partial [Paraburkholderia panacisoli]
PRFLPTLGHPRAVALRFARCDQLAAGLAPTRVRPCWAHTKKPSPDSSGDGFSQQVHALTREYHTIRIE